MTSLWPIIVFIVCSTFVSVYKEIQAGWVHYGACFSKPLCSKKGKKGLVKMLDQNQLKHISIRFELLYINR